jgi:hypothetical protein
MLAKSLGDCPKQGKHQAGREQRAYQQKPGISDGAAVKHHGRGDKLLCSLFKSAKRSRFAPFTFLMVRGR